MPVVPIAAVKPGSVLASAATDARGNALVGEGKVLTEEWLQRLKARGITSLNVTLASGEEGGSAGPSASRSPPSLLLRAGSRNRVTDQ